MKDIVSHFAKIAPYIANAVKHRINSDMTDNQVMEVIHEEILFFFEKGNQMTVEFLLFNSEQRAIFFGLMYEMAKPLANQMKQGLNPNYEAYVQRTGKTGAKNFINNA